MQLGSGPMRHPIFPAVTHRREAMGLGHYGCHECEGQSKDMGQCQQGAACLRAWPAGSWAVPAGPVTALTLGPGATAHLWGRGQEAAALRGLHAPLSPAVAALPGVPWGPGRGGSHRLRVEPVSGQEIPQVPEQERGWQVTKWPSRVARPAGACREGPGGCGWGPGRRR